MTREIPVVYAERRPNGDLAVLCPYCRIGQSKKDVYHLHGGEPDSRSSHCWNPESPYYNRNVIVALREDDMRRLVESIWTKPHADEDEAQVIDRKDG